MRFSLHRFQCFHHFSVSSFTKRKCLQRCRQTEHREKREKREKRERKSNRQSRRAPRSRGSIKAAAKSDRQPSQKERQTDIAQEIYFYLINKTAKKKKKKRREEKREPQLLYTDTN